MSYSLNSWYPLSNPYNSPLYNPLSNLHLGSLEYSAYGSLQNILEPEEARHWQGKPVQRHADDCNHGEIQRIRETTGSW